ncbi:MAG: divergent polysaccharide deacetylase family protein [Candidatus Omnitrophota bacterium]
MNNFKNIIIGLLSLIVFVQSLFLFYFISRSRRVVSVSVQREAEPENLLRGKAVAPDPVEPAEEKKFVSDRPVASSGKIVLVLDDWGYNLKNRDFITGNNYHVTVSILPFRTYSATIAKLAYDKDKDVIIHVPMEPESKGSYGLEDKTLLIGMSQEETDKILQAALKDVPYAKGISNHMGSEATKNKRLMKIVMAFLKQNNLFFLDSVVTSKSVCSVCAKKAGVASIRRDVFIDNESDPAYIRKQVMKLAAKAKSSGIAVGIGHDRPMTIAVLEEVIPELEREGFEFVNLSQALNLRKDG